MGARYDATLPLCSCGRDQHHASGRRTRAKKTEWSAVLLVGAALFITGCNSTGADPTSTTTFGTTSPSSVKVATASAAAVALSESIPEVTKVVDLTEDTDVNNLLGRPNGYLAATVLYDSRATCDSSGPGVDCGAVIEQFPNAASAQRRSDYIQKVRGAAQGLGQEYNTVSGGLLLRVSGDLKPSAAKRYKEVFTGS